MDYPYIHKHVFSRFNNLLSASSRRLIISSALSSPLYSPSRASNPFRFGTGLIKFSTLREGKRSNVCPFQDSVISPSLVKLTDVSGWSTAANRICNGLAIPPCCLYGSSCCLGCDAQHKLMTGQQSQSQPRYDTWTSSRCEMDNTSGLSLDSHGTMNTSHRFINHGFLLWNQSRQEWIRNERNKQGDQLREPRLSKNATYESLLGSNKPFAKPVPLSEMVEFLVDIWEQDGMYD